MYQKCPICEGRQTAPAGFSGDACPTDDGEVVCRTCNGAGTLWTGGAAHLPEVYPSAPAGTEPWTFRPTDCIKCRSRGGMICICTKMAGAAPPDNRPSVVIGGH